MRERRVGSPLPSQSLASAAEGTNWEFQIVSRRIIFSHIRNQFLSSLIRDKTRDFRSLEILKLIDNFFKKQINKSK